MYVYLFLYGMRSPIYDACFSDLMAKAFDIGDAL